MAVSGGPHVIALIGPAGTGKTTVGQFLAAEIGARFVFVHLDVPPDVLARRLSERQNHFAGLTLLSSQLATFERPHHAVVVDGRLPVDALVEAIRIALQL